MEKNYKIFQEGTRKVLEESKKETKPYFHEVCGENFIVLPNVFSPKYFEDTEFFARTVGNYTKNKGIKCFTEIGGGTGIVSCMVGKNTDYEMLITDINPDAIKNIKLNVIMHNLDCRTKVIQSDIFESVKGTSDIIFWNVPFGDYSPEQMGILEQAVFDPGYVNLEKFISGAKNRLAKDGALLIGFSKDLGKMDVLENLLKKYKFVPPKIIAESEPSYEGNKEELVKFHLFESRFL